MNPALSVLTPAIWDRIDQSRALADEIARQLQSLGGGTAPPYLEHITLLDDMTRSVGLKRQALLDAARGDYIAFLDDDDWITPDYVQILLTAAQRGADVITFRQKATINGKDGHIDFRIDAPGDEPWQEGITAVRKPWHVCAWKRSLVADCVFPDINDGEDIVWCQQARQRVRTGTHIDRVLHHYRFDQATTAATGK